MPGDAAGVAHVHRASWRTTYPGLIPAHVVDDWANLERRTTAWSDVIAARADSVWVAERGGEIVGFADGGKAREPDDGCSAQLYAIYLLQSVQRSGVGRALLSRVFADLCATPGTRVRAWRCSRGMHRRLPSTNQAARISCAKRRSA